MIAFVRSLIAVVLALSACAAAPAAPPSQSTAAAHRVSADLKANWWRDNRWRYADDAAADSAYQRLVTQQSPWPAWHQAHVVTLPVGLRFQMALSPGQPTDSPGGFGTFDRIPDVRYVRQKLAVKVAWKPQIDRVATFEIVDPLSADTGVVGPQIDEKAGAYLPGGGSQFQMMVPGGERMRHLKLVAVRPIH